MLQYWVFRPTNQREKATDMSYQAPQPTPPDQPVEFHPPATHRPQVNGFAITSLVLGIIAVLFALIPLLGAPVAVPVAIIGALFGVVALVLAFTGKRGRKAMSVVGLLLNLTAFFVAGAFAASVVAAVNEANETSPPAVSASPSPTSTASPSKTSASIPSETSASPDVSSEFKAALEQAQSYAETMHMSKKGVYEQLTSEYGGGFPAAAAKYAVDNVTADWKANALAKARSYREDMDMSREAIRKQLTSKFGEQFTAAEADYAIKHLD